MPKLNIDKPFLSVAMITFNEERIIEKTISTLHNWVDEIVVVDSYSTDGTLNILEIFNVTVYKEKWQGYSKQKNLALSRCTGKWILSLDADEVVSQKLKDEIQNTIKNPGQYAGFKIPRKLYIGKRWVKYGGYYPDMQLRLFKGSTNVTFKERAVHESIELNGLSVGHFTNPIEHYAYKDVLDYKNNMEKYAELAACEIKHKSFYVPLVRGMWAFIYRYIFRLGFLEGKLGFELAKTYGNYVCKKYLLAIKLNQG